MGIDQGKEHRRAARSSDALAATVQCRDGRSFGLWAGRAGVSEQGRALMAKRYGWRGYGVPREQGFAGAMSFLARGGDGEAWGSIQSRPGADATLACEAAYGPEVALLRAKGMSPCEVGSLAVEEGSPKEVICALFHAAYLHSCEVSGCGIILAEVNPRHEAVYRRALGFKLLGGLRDCQRVGAPCMLLGLEAIDARASIQKWAAAARIGEPSSFYALFMDPIQAAAAREAIRKLGKKA